MGFPVQKSLDLEGMIDISTFELSGSKVPREWSEAKRADPGMRPLKYKPFFSPPLKLPKPQKTVGLQCTGEGG